MQNEKLTGVIELRDKIVILEDIENPILSKVLHYRLSQEKFSFFGGGGYKENKSRPKTHTDKTYSETNHRDNYRDGHTDHFPSDLDGEHSDKFGGHTDTQNNSGYSETNADKRYHIDYYN